MDPTDVNARIMSEREFFMKYGGENPSATLKQAEKEYEKYRRSHGKQASNTCLLGG